MKKYNIIYTEGGKIMPTGYTARIKDGITFQQFAMNCARAFGACIMMRDDPADKPIPEKFEPSVYHKERLKEAYKELERIDSLSIDESREKAVIEFTKEVQRREQDMKKDRELMNQYKDMLQKVKQWQPPTRDHIEFKEFMVSQIEDSIEFDGMENYYIEHPIKKITGKEWLVGKRKSALWDIDYHTKEYKAEIERTNQRNKWIRDLRDSLKV